MDNKKVSTDGANKEYIEETKIWNRNFFFIAIINFSLFFGFNMTMTGIPVYISKLGGTDMVAGLATTLATVAALIIRPFSGMIIDKFGEKKVLMSSIIMMVLVISAFAIFPFVGLIVAIRAIQGIGWGLSSTVTFTIATGTIPKAHLAEGLGYFSLSASITNAIAPALSIALIQKIGITPMVVVAAGFTFLCLIISSFLPTAKSPQKKNRENTKKAKEATKDKAVEKKKLDFNNFFEKKSLLSASMMLILNFGFAAISTFLALHGASVGVEDVYIYFTIYAIVTFVCRPFVGKLIDRIGFFLPGVFSTICIFMTILMVAISTNLFLFSIAGVFAGLGFGTSMSTFQSMAVISVPRERRGIASSTFLFGLDAGIAAGAIFDGAIANMFGYVTMYYATLIFPIMACVILLIYGSKRMKKNYS